MVSSGLFCWGSQKPSLLRTFTALAGTANFPRIHHWKSPCRSQQTALRESRQLLLLKNTMELKNSTESFNNGLDKTERTSTLEERSSETIISEKQKDKVIKMSEERPWDLQGTIKRNNLYIELQKKRGRKE